MNIGISYKIINIIKIGFDKIIFDAEHDKIMQAAFLRLQLFRKQITPAVISKRPDIFDISVNAF